MPFAARAASPRTPMNTPLLTPAITLRLPFTGTWFVAHGGDTLNVNHHMAVRAQWFGIDFARVGGPSGRELAREPAATVEDCHSWDQEVLSPLAGVVVGAESHHTDNPLGTVDTVHPVGNFVEIRSAGGLHVFIAHLRQGSVRVKAGDTLAAGQVLGRCGNSGHSTMPHVHLHVQDAAGFGHGSGVMAAFEGIDVELSGRSFTNVAWPLLRGLFVRPHRP